MNAASGSYSFLGFACLISSIFIFVRLEALYKTVFFVRSILPVGIHEYDRPITKTQSEFIQGLSILVVFVHICSHFVF